MAAAFAVAVVAGGCSTLPTSGAVQLAGAGQVGIGQDYSQPIPVGPGPGWTTTEIVSGFLAASASFANDHQVAREYLDSTAQHRWRPGWAVTVVSRPPTTSTAAPSIRQPLAGQQQEEDQAGVKVTGLPVATLTDTGQYLVSSGSSSQSYDYNLLKINGQWRIDTLPTSQLLLTQADFERVYQPRDLYFLTQSGRTLVPDPVFVPQQATNTELATGLVKALLQDPEGWLSGAALTGFPSSVSLIDNPVIINGSNAIVDLGEKHATSSRRQLEQMAAQLAWTLGSGPTTIQSVELQINGRPVQIAGSQYQLPQTFGSWVPTQPDGSSLYVVTSHGAVQELSGIGQPGSGRAAAVPGPAGTACMAGHPGVQLDRRLARPALGGRDYRGRRGRLHRRPQPPRPAAGVAADQRQLHLGELGRPGQPLDRRRRRGLDAAAGRHLRAPGHHGRRATRGRGDPVPGGPGRRPGCHDRPRGVRPQAG